MLPAAHELLLDHKAAYGLGPKDPVFATRNGRRNTVDNVRRTIVDAAVAKANELLRPRSTSRSSTWVTASFETAIGCTLGEAFTMLSGRGFRLPIVYRPKTTPPSSADETSWKARKRLRRGNSRKRLKGLKPSTFRMASRPYLGRFAALSLQSANSVGSTANSHAPRFVTFRRGCVNQLSTRSLISWRACSSTTPECRGGEGAGAYTPGGFARLLE
jgi:hypothetical protein